MDQPPENLQGKSVKFVEQQNIFIKQTLLQLLWSTDNGLIVSRWFRFNTDSDFFAIFGLAGTTDRTTATTTAAAAATTTTSGNRWCTMHKRIFSRWHSFIDCIQALCFSKWGDFVIRRKSLKCCVFYWKNFIFLVNKINFNWFL